MMKPSSQDLSKSFYEVQPLVMVLRLQPERLQPMMLRYVEILSLTLRPPGLGERTKGLR